MAKLTKEQIVTIQVLHEQGASHCQAARLLGVTEGAVRYHVRRHRAGATDGRTKLTRIEAEGLARAAKTWWSDQASRLPADRSPSVSELHAWLQSEHGYRGSYKSVRKHVRKHFPGPKRKVHRRIETPPGAQSQTDWGEFRGVDIGDPNGPSTLYAFVMILSHSRMEAVIWSRSMDQLAWHRCHNEAYKRLGGVAAVNRIDNLKTGISRGAGPWGQVNEQYLRYARTLGFHVDAHEPSQPQQKGKVERRVGVSKSWNPAGRAHDALEALQAWTDGRVIDSAKRRICPATGQSVFEAWHEEIAALRPLPALLPEPFDLVGQRKVGKDASVKFEGRTYIVPFRYAGEQVEVRGCSGVVQVLDMNTGDVLVQYPRHSDERILIDPSCYEGESTDRVERPRPLGRMSRRLMDLASAPVEQRPLDLYAELAEVAQ